MLNSYYIEWLNLLLRFAHVITGIAWIGASFYFIWLDNHLEKPPQWKTDKGIKGDLWAIHGGGFYEVAKYQLAPPHIPQNLHWFKWEAYSTWITGFFLLALMYYVGAESYLIDKRVADLSQWQAIGIGLSVITASWFGYDILCNTKLANHGALLGVILLVLATGIAYFLTQVFSARGAYIHMGAIIGTIMAANVFRIIIPGQKALVAAVEAGGAPDPIWAIKAKLRSTHNTYTTLPVIFIMISNHYPITYNHAYSWAVLVVIILLTAATRQYFVLRHTGINKPLIIVAVSLATIALAIAIAPRPVIALNPENTTIDVMRVEQIVKSRCTSCHSATPTDDVFKLAPAGVILDDRISLQQWAPRIKARVIDAQDMPFMNKTNMTKEERSIIAAWLVQIAATE